MPASDGKLLLTQRAYDLLLDELSYLEGEGRQKVIEAIATARAHGDLSENAEYHAAREEQGLQEARVRQLRAMIDRAEIIQSDDDETVKPGKVVTILHDGDDEPETYLIGLREERESAGHDILTPTSPLGEALVGHRAGDSVTAKAPAGALKVDIIAVRAL